VSQLFKPGSIVIVVGPGGVGKTTVAAALGMAAATTNLATAVITIDPARRLRDALGLTGSVAARPARLDGRRLRAAGLDPKLPLAVIALDVKATWVGLIERFVQDAESRRRIFANAFYRNLTERFAGAESYAALELLHDLHERCDFALAIVDTPPAMHAFDFIEAPDHLARLLDSKTARWVMQRAAPAKRPGLHLGGRAARLLLEQLERVAGAHPLAAIAEFLAATADAADAIRQRMGATAALLRSPEVRFVLVTTAAADRLSEAAALARQMKAARLRLERVVINRLTDEATFAAIRTAPAHTAELRRELATIRAAVVAGGRAPTGSAAIVAYLEDYLAEQAAALARVAQFRRALPGRIAVTALPEIAGIAGELSGLARLATILADDHSGENSHVDRGWFDAATEAAIKAAAGERRPRASNQRLG
jgi:anion-transporting  ArsA/GET3 family ATPase